MNFGVDPSQIRPGDRIFVEGEVVSYKVWRKRPILKINLHGSKVVNVTEFSRLVSAKQVTQSRLSDVRERSELTASVADARLALIEKSNKIAELETELYQMRATLDKMRAHSAGLVIR